MTDAEFEDAKQFWLMFQAKETFKAVHQGCLELVRSGLSETSPLYFPTIAGLICLYGKPFKNNKGVGKLPIEMVPKEQLSLHNQIIVIRDKLYAHSDADKTVIVGNLHFGEVRCYRWPDDGGYYIEHLQLGPEFFSKFMAVLADQMREKTNDYVDKLGKKLAQHVPQRPGEFLLNIKDKEGPLFTEVEPLRPRKGWRSGGTA
jgi:hypothetical protein